MTGAKTLVSSAILAGALLAGAGSPAEAAAPLNNPALLNIGLVCKWDSRCIKRQERAMGRALSYVKTRRPPQWKIQACNRNAARGRNRVDWVGYVNCITNPRLARAPVRSRRR